MRERNLLVSMVALQVMWVVAMWVTGAASNWRKLPPLLVYSLVAGAAIGFMPARITARIRCLKDQLVEDEKRLLLALCVVTLASGFVYANFQRILTDEGHLFNASRIVAEEGAIQFFADYTDIQWLGHQHPPGVPLFYGFTMRIFSVRILVVRIVSLMFTTATVLLTYFLGRELYNRETGLLAALLLLSFPYTLRMGVAALTDMPVTFFFSLVLFLILRLLHTPMYRLSLAAGLAVGAGLLSKYTMALIFPLLLGYFSTDRAFRRLKVHLVIVGLVSTSVFAVWLVYAYQSNVLASQVDTITFYAGVATSPGGGTRWMLESVLTRLPSALGLYHIPLLLLGGMHLVRRRGQSDRFVLMWVIVVFVILILTLPDARYFMPAFPALAIAAVRGFQQLPKATERVVVLGLLYCGGALYLFTDWYRAAHLFLP